MTDTTIQILVATGFAGAALLAVLVIFRPRWFCYLWAKKPSWVKMPSWSIKRSSKKPNLVLELIRYSIGIFSTLLWIGIVAWLLDQLYLPATIVVSSVLFGIVGLMIILPLVPKGIEYLSNDPNRFASAVSEEKRKQGEYPKYDFGFFTFLSPDRAKIIERGEGFVRIVMRLDDHTFYGETEEGMRKKISPKEQEYWRVVKTPDGEEDYHPVPDRGLKSLINPFWWWQRYVYLITKAVFTGIPPFQKVRTYKITRSKRVPLGGGKSDLVPITDWSDHYRVAEDQIFVEVEEADTRDKLPVNVQQAITIRVTNPYMTAYNTSSNWAVRATTTFTDAINTFTRQRTADEVVSIREGTDERAFSRAILSQANGDTEGSSGGPTLFRFGIIATEAALLRNELDGRVQEKLQDEAIAAADARARELRGQGEAKAAELLIEAVGKKGEFGLRVFETEARVRQANAVGQAQGTLIMGGDSGINPSTALLHNDLNDLKEKP